MIEQLRSLLLKADPDIVEEAKWRKASNPDGVPTFSCDGIVCTVETYQDKVKLTFAQGAALDDASGLFNASLDAERITRTIQTMRQFKIVASTVSAGSPLVDRGPIAAVIGELGAWTGDPRWR